MYICEYCNAEHDGSYGSGRFCSSKCAKKFSQKFITEDGRNRQIRVLTNPDNREKAVNGYRKYCQAKVLAKRDIPRYEKTLSKGFNHRVSKGTIGESMAVLKFMQRDIPVAEILIDLCGVDLLAYFGGRWNTIQVKTSTYTVDDYGNNISFSLTGMNYVVDGNKMYYSKKNYPSKDIDYFILYDALHNELFMIKNDGMRKNIIIRYKKPNGINDKGINYAVDYQIDNVLDNIEYGYTPDNIVMINGVDC